MSEIAISGNLAYSEGRVVHSETYCEKSSFVFESVAFLVEVATDGDCLLVTVYELTYDPDFDILFISRFLGFSLHLIGAGYA